MWFYFILTIFLWGIAPLLERTGLKYVDEYTALFIRSTAVFIAILAVFIFSGKVNDLGKLELKPVILFCCSGLVAGLLGMWLYFKLLKGNPSSLVVPLVAAYPMVTAILGVLLFKEEMTWLRFIGIVLIVIGVSLVK